MPAHDSDWGINFTSAGTSVVLAAHTPSALTTLIAVGITVSGGVTLQNVVDSTSDTYLIVPNNYTTAGGNHGYVAYSLAPSTASKTITVNLSGSGNVVAGASAFTGTATTSAFDKAVSGIGGPSGALDSGAGPNTTFANEVLFGVGGLDSGSSTSAWTAGGAQDGGSGYTISGQLNGSPIDTVIQWQIVNATGSFHSTATNTANTTHNWGMLMATFADTPVPGPTVDAGAVWIGQSGPSLMAPFNMNQFQAFGFSTQPGLPFPPSGGGSGKYRRRFHRYT